MYKIMKEAREAAKYALIEDLNNSYTAEERKDLLSNYMGKQGTFINKFVDKKVAEDYNEADLVRVIEGLPVVEFSILRDRTRSRSSCFPAQLGKQCSGSGYKILCSSRQ